MANADSNEMAILPTAIIIAIIRLLNSIIPTPLVGTAINTEIQGLVQVGKKLVAGQQRQRDLQSCAPRHAWPRQR